MLCVPCVSLVVCGLVCCLLLGVSCALFVVGCWLFVVCLCLNYRGLWCLLCVVYCVSRLVCWSCFAFGD